MRSWGVFEQGGLFSSWEEFSSTDEACELIVHISSTWAWFWPRSSGWAPPEAVKLMSQPLMDRQREMALALQKWPQRLATDCSPGELVTAWTVLGSVLEGALRVYMCVFYSHWIEDDATPQKKGGKKALPAGGGDAASLNRIIHFVKAKQIFRAAEIDFLTLVQGQRNLIHPLKSGVVLDRSAFDEAVIHTARLHDDIELRLPYPDELPWRD